MSSGKAKRGRQARARHRRACQRSRNGPPARSTASTCPAAAPRTGADPRRGNRESWIRAAPNDRGYYEARVWIGTRLTPWRASNIRSDCLEDNAAAFEVEYAGANGTGARAAKDTLLTIVPRERVSAGRKA